MEGNAASQQQSINRSFVIATRYRPFVIGLALVLLTTIALTLAKSAVGKIMPDSIMAAFMGSFFIIFALPKFLHLDRFVEMFSQYDIVTQRFRPYAWALPFVEFSLGSLLLADYIFGQDFGGVSVNVAIVLITATTLVGITKTLRQNKQVDCACMGAAFTFPLSKIAIIENGTMLVMAIAMLASSITGHMMMPMGAM